MKQHIFQTRNIKRKLALAVTYGYSNCQLCAGEGEDVVGSGPGHPTDLCMEVGIQSKITQPRMREMLASSKGIGAMHPQVSAPDWRLPTWSKIDRNKSSRVLFLQRLNIHNLFKCLIL